MVEVTAVDALACIVTITCVYLHVYLQTQVCFVVAVVGAHVTRDWLEFQVNTHLVLFHVTLLIALEGTAWLVTGHHRQSALVNSLDVKAQQALPCSHEVTAVVSAQ